MRKILPKQRTRQTKPRRKLTFKQKAIFSLGMIGMIIILLGTDLRTRVTDLIRRRGI